MELIGSFPDGEWDFFSKMFASEDHEHYSQQFLDQNSLLLDDGLMNNESQSTFSSAEIGEKECMFYSFDHANISNSHYISQSQENSYSSNCSANDDTNYYFSYPNQVLANNMNSSISMDEKFFASFVTPFNEIVMEENVKLNEDAIGSDGHILEKNDYINTPIMEEHVDFPNKHKMEMQLKRKLDVIEKINNNSESPKKKSRVSKNVS